MAEGRSVFIAFRLLELKSQSMLYILGIYLVLVSGIVYPTERILNIPLAIFIVGYFYAIMRFGPWLSLEQGEKSVLRFFWSFILTSSLEKTLLAISIITAFYEVILKYEVELFILFTLVLVLIYFKFSGAYLEEAFKE